MANKTKTTPNTDIAQSFTASPIEVGEYQTAMEHVSQPMCNNLQQMQIKGLLRSLGWDETAYREMLQAFPDMTAEIAEEYIKSLTTQQTVRDAMQAVPPANVMPSVDIQRQNNIAAQQANAQIQNALAATKVFGQTPAISVEAPAPDSDYLAKANLIGVTFTCLSVEVHPSNFAQDNPNKPRPNVADYKVVIDQRPDLGIRIVSLGNGLSVNQAMVLAPAEFPFKATLEYGENKGNFSPPFLLASPRAKQEIYFHPSEESAKTVNSGFRY